MGFCINGVAPGLLFPVEEDILGVGINLEEVIPVIPFQSFGECLFIPGCDQRGAELITGQMCRCPGGLFQDPFPGEKFSIKFRIGIQKSDNMTIPDLGYPDGMVEIPHDQFAAIGKHNIIFHPFYGID